MLISKNSTYNFMYEASSVGQLSVLMCYYAQEVDTLIENSSKQSGKQRWHPYMDMLEICMHKIQHNSIQYKQIWSSTASLSNCKWKFYFIQIFIMNVNLETSRSDICFIPLKNCSCNSILIL